MSNQKKLKDIVAIGAMNYDFIVPLTARRQELEASGQKLTADTGQPIEQSVTEEQFMATLADQQKRYPGQIKIEYGGSAYNVVQSIWEIDNNTKMTYIGAYGRFIGFEDDDRMPTMNFAADMKRRNIQFMGYTAPPGKMSGGYLSYFTGGDQADQLNQYMKTFNSEEVYAGFCDYIDNNFDEVIQEIIKHRILHVTSLFNEEAARRAHRIVMYINQNYPSILISCDPGPTWLDVEDDAESTRGVGENKYFDYVREIMTASNIIFGTAKEIDILMDKFFNLGHIVDRVERVRALFEASPDLRLAGEMHRKWESVAMHYRGARGVIESVRASFAIRQDQVEDVTGAGDVMAAGILYSYLQEDASSRFAAKLALFAMQRRVSNVGYKFEEKELEDMLESEGEWKQHLFDDEKQIMIVSKSDYALAAKIHAVLGAAGANPLTVDAKPGDSVHQLVKDALGRACMAIVIYSPDDAIEEYDKDRREMVTNYRARQNVVYEHGFLFARLGADRVVAIIDDEEKPISLPSDFKAEVSVGDGVYLDTDEKRRLYIRTHDAGHKDGWAFKLLEYIQAQGIKVDIQKGLAAFTSG